MKFNEKMVLLRKNKKLSQEELANLLGVARQTISKWELGETTPEMDKLIKISEIFEMSLDELIKEETETINIPNTLNVNNNNTQKLAGLTIKILKVILIVFMIFIILGIGLSVIGLISFKNTKNVENNEVTVKMDEMIDEGDNLQK